MNQFPDAIKKLIDKLSHLPGIGPKTAERLVFYWLKQDPRQVDDLVASISRLRKEVSVCPECFNVSSSVPCNFCADPKRDHQTICVVAEPQDVLIIERTGDYHGLYHILGGIINPVEGITADQLKIKELTTRIKTAKNNVKEVIIATNPDLEGESTAMYLARLLKPMNVAVTRLAKGLPIGSTIEYADEITVSNALRGRQTL